MLGQWVFQLAFNNSNIFYIKPHSEVLMLLHKVLTHGIELNYQINIYIFCFIFFFYINNFLHKHFFT